MPARYKGGRLNPEILRGRRWSKAHLWVPFLPFPPPQPFSPGPNPSSAPGPFALPFRCVFRGLQVWIDLRSFWITLIPEPLGFISHSWKGQSHQSLQPQGQTEEALLSLKRGCCSQSRDSQHSPPNHSYNSARMIFKLLFLAHFSLFVSSSVAPVRHF